MDLRAHTLTFNAQTFKLREVFNEIKASTGFPTPSHPPSMLGIFLQLPGRTSNSTTSKPPTSTPKGLFPLWTLNRLGVELCLLPKPKPYTTKILSLSSPTHLSVISYTVRCKMLFALLYFFQPSTPIVNYTFCCSIVLLNA